MTRIGIVLALCIAAVGCKPDGAKETADTTKGAPSPALATFTDKGAAAQQRIGTYLQDAVVTDRLRSCWSRIKGQGALATDLTYTKSGSNWSFENAKVTKSTLADLESSAALKCLEESARGTTFPVNTEQALETEAPRFIVRLGWSVPLPPKGGEISSTQMARMVATGGGNGVITIPGCSDCVSNPNYPYGYKCEAKSSGRDVDCEEISSNVCATTPQACLQGVFGGKRGVIMF